MIFKRPKHDGHKQPVPVQLEVQLQELRMELAQLIYTLTNQNVRTWESQSVALGSVQEGRLTSLNLTLSGAGSEVLPRLLTEQGPHISQLLSDMKALYDQNNAQAPMGMTVTVSKEGNANFSFEY